MATNERYTDADYLSLPVPNSTASGTAVRVGTFSATTGLNLNGVTQTSTGAAGEPTGGNATGYASVKLKGAFKLAVSTTTTLAVGDPVYITSAYVLTPVSTSNALFGHALSAKGATAGTLVTIRIKN